MRKNKIVPLLLEAKHVLTNQSLLPPKKNNTKLLVGSELKTFRTVVKCYTTLLATIVCTA